MKADKAYPVNECRLCGSTRLKTVSQLTPTPIGDKFMYDRKEAAEWNTHKVELVLCSECGQIQLSEVVEPEQVYDDYLYTTAISHGLSEHFHQGAENLLNTIRPEKGSLIMEIGSNEGVILKYFRSEGFRVLGIDPAERIAKQATEQGITTLPEFFDDKLAEKIVKEYGKTSLLIANNVIANIPDLHGVAKGIEKILTDEGVFVFETSYAPDVVEHHLIDTIYHEHISYLSAAPLERFFALHGLSLFDAERINTKGGSLRGYVKKASANPQKTERLKNIISAEKASGIFSPERYGLFNENLKKFGEDIRSYAMNLKSEGKQVAVYGASVGCIMMICHFGLADITDIIVDDNPAKTDRYSPGQGIRVFSSEILKSGKPDRVISLAWRFMDPICERNREFLKNGGKFAVINLSKLSIEEM